MTTLTLRAQMAAVIQAMQLGRQASHTLQTMTTAAMGARAMAVARPAVDSTEARTHVAGASHRERCRPYTLVTRSPGDPREEDSGRGYG